MLNALLLSSCAASAMTLSNNKNYEIQQEYELLTKKSWQNLSILSVIFGIFLGTFSYYGMVASENENEAYYFAIYAAILGYSAIMSIYTDFALLKVDRYMLRLGYFFVFILSAIYTAMNYFGILRGANITELALIYATLFALFIFSPIGASDVRALAIILPFPFLVGNMMGLALFIVTTLFVAFEVWLWQHKMKMGKIPVPILPYMFLPYVIASPMFGYLINYWQSKSL